MLDLARSLAAAHPTLNGSKSQVPTRFRLLVLARARSLQTGLVLLPFLPGDSLLFIAGTLAAQPELRLSVVVMWLLLVIAAVAGDALNYWIGSRVGPSIFRWEESTMASAGKASLQSPPPCFPPCVFSCCYSTFKPARLGPRMYVSELVNAWSKFIGLLNHSYVFACECMCVDRPSVTFSVCAHCRPARFFPDASAQPRASAGTGAGLLPSKPIQGASTRGAGSTAP